MALKILQNNIFFQFFSLLPNYSQASGNTYVYLAIHIRKRFFLIQRCKTYLCLRQTIIKKKLSLFTYVRVWYRKKNAINVNASISVGLFELSDTEKTYCRKNEKQWVSVFEGNKNRLQTVCCVTVFVFRLERFQIRKYFEELKWIWETISYLENPKNNNANRFFENTGLYVLAVQENSRNSPFEIVHDIG